VKVQSEICNKGINRMHIYNNVTNKGGETRDYIDVFKLRYNKDIINKIIAKPSEGLTLKLVCNFKI